MGAVLLFLRILAFRVALRESVAMHTPVVLQSSTPAEVKQVLKSNPKDYLPIKPHQACPEWWMPAQRDRISKKVAMPSAAITISGNGRNSLISF
jgi:predicted secreted protein